MDNYWATRTQQRLVSAEQMSIPAMRGTLAIYERALKNINKEINALYQEYSTETGLDVSELSQIITGAEKRNFLINVQKKMIKLGFKLEDIYIPDYLNKLSRLDAFKQQVYWEIINISPQETTITGRAYASIIDKSYNQLIEDFNDMGIVGGAFNRIDTQSIKQIMSFRWERGNWSSRVWDNTTLLARRLPNILGAGLTAGLSNDKISEQLRKEFDVSRGSAMRLIRTETNFFYNQAEAEASMNMGLEKYEFYAVMDSRTSQICQEHNGEVYLFKDMQVGENYPPLHPNCRSTVMPLLEGERRYDRLRGLKRYTAGSGLRGFNLEEFYETEKVRPQNLEYITARANKNSMQVWQFPKGTTAEEITKEMGTTSWVSRFIKNPANTSGSIANEIGDVKIEKYVETEGVDHINFFQKEADRWIRGVEYEGKQNAYDYAMRDFPELGDELRKRTFGDNPPLVAQMYRVGGVREGVVSFFPKKVQAEQYAKRFGVDIVKKYYAATRNIIPSGSGSGELWVDSEDVLRSLKEALEALAEEKTAKNPNK